MTLEQCPSPPDMDDCKTKKKRCLKGACVGETYTAGKECPTGYEFDKENCKCKYNTGGAGVEPGVYKAVSTWNNGSGEIYQSCYAFTILAPFFDTAGNLREQVWAQNQPTRTPEEIENSVYKTLAPLGGQGVPLCDGNQSSMVPWANAGRYGGFDPQFCAENPDYCCASTRVGYMQLLTILNGSCYSTDFRDQAYISSTSITSGCSVGGYVEGSTQIEYLGPGTTKEYYPDLQNVVGAYDWAFVGCDVEPVDPNAPAPDPDPEA